MNCPRCDGDMPSTLHKGQYPGALSRYDNATEVCSSCGVEEAIAHLMKGWDSLHPVTGIHPWVRPPAQNWTRAPIS